MLENLTSRFSRIVGALGRKRTLTERNVADTLKDVRMALLDADVSLGVVRQFVAEVQQKAVGTSLGSGMTPGQGLAQVLRESLIELLGGANDALNLRAAPPVVVLLVGVQGAGKTTTAAKLAHLLKTRDGQQVSLVSTDVYRPAALEQLAILSREVGVVCHAAASSEQPVDIAKRAVHEARVSGDQVLIVDSAGRSQLDDEMMCEIESVHAAISPTETLFVLDAMAGQDAARTAAAFHKTLALTGTIITKADGDARGGAMITVRALTNCPIKFIGVGEKIDALEPFHPERMVSRILGQGDVATLMEEAARKVDQKSATRVANRIVGGKRFDLQDFRDSMANMRKMGGVEALGELLPAPKELLERSQHRVDQQAMKRNIAVIDSMTPHERQFPQVISGSRKNRIARGAGVDVRDVAIVLREFKQMQKASQKFSRKGFQKKLRMAAELQRRA
ncbi:MAG: signal recognition particle protein [Gammaproteobacteria bacterium]|nr:signal recognition particle protein [Gammaproteobacteria bacterium]MCY4200415.1 signal recognition particle protein [Gammaproteobacteria bacterium]MCY4278602.1 signal recognition particle protein [Gammaproteobacteria bacterium]MCY4322344.1 signal recognition particle protein [Gammaproteobacteria bacterium]